MTDAERDAALSLCSFWQRFRDNPTRAFIHAFVPATVGVGVLAIGLVHFLLGRFVDIPRPTKTTTVVVIGLIGGGWSGWDARRRALHNRGTVAELERKYKEAIERGEVCVYRSAQVQSRFDHDANSEHPPLIIDFGNGDALTLGALEQSQLRIDGEISGTCEVVTLPDDGPILSLSTAAGTRYHGTQSDA